MYWFPLLPAMYGCPGCNQALGMYHFEAIWVVIKSMDSGVRQPGFSTWLYDSTLVLTVWLWLTSLTTLVSQLSHLLNGKNNNGLILLG